MRFSSRRLAVGAMLAVAIMLSWLAPQAARAEAPEKTLETALTNTLHEAVPQLKDHYFSYVIGIDTSGSYADSNKMAFTKLALEDFLRTNAVPGESVAVFAFGPRPYPVLERDFFKLPEGMAEARAAVQNLNGEMSRGIQRNNEFGTDVNYAFSYALDMASKAPNKNCLVMLFTDSYNESAKWSRDPAHLRLLKEQLGRFGGKDLTTELGRGYHMRYSFVVKDDALIHVPAATGSPTPGADPRAAVNEAMNASPSPGASGVSGVSGASGVSGVSGMSGASGVSGASGASGASGVSGASESPSPSPSPEASEEGGGTPWLFLLLLLALAVGIGLALTRPLPITVVATHQKPVYLPLNQPFTIGGPANDTLADLSMPLPNEPIAQFTHVFPRKLRASHLKSGAQSRIVADSGEEVAADVPVVVENEAEVSWTDRQTGKPYTLRVVKGKPTNEAEQDAEQDV